MAYSDTMNIQRPVSKRSGRPSYADREGHGFEVFRRECSRIVLSRSAPAPLWEQLSHQLENLILSGKLAADSRIPPESVLCELFGVSKPVVRHAISALTARGLVIKMPRKGMFVGNPPRESSFVTANVSLFDDMMARGAQIDTKTFDFHRAEADDQEREALRLEPGEDVVRVVRVFWVDGAPITHTVISFPAAKVPGFEEEEIEGRSILGTIRDRYGRRLVRADRWISAAMPEPHVRERMGLNNEDPLIWIESIGFETDGSALEYYRAYYNSKAARIRISVSD